LGEEVNSWEKKQQLVGGEGGGGGGEGVLTMTCKSGQKDREERESTAQATQEGRVEVPSPPSEIQCGARENQGKKGNRRTNTTTKRGGRGTNNGQNHAMTCKRGGEKTE